MIQLYNVSDVTAEVHAASCRPIVVLAAITVVHFQRIEIHKRKQERRLFSDHFNHYTLPGPLVHWRVHSGFVPRLSAELCNKWWAYKVWNQAAHASNFRISPGSSDMDGCLIEFAAYARNCLDFRPCEAWHEACSLSPARTFAGWNTPLANAGHHKTIRQILQVLWFCISLFFYFILKEARAWLLVLNLARDDLLSLWEKHLVL